MAASILIHLKHEASAGQRFHFARHATRAVQRDPDLLRRELVVHRQANRAKHSPARSRRPASSPSCLVPDPWAGKSLPPAPAPSLCALGDAWGSYIGLQCDGKELELEEDACVDVGNGDSVAGGNACKVPAATSMEDEANRSGEDARGNWQSLPPAGWQAIHQRFSAFRSRKNALNGVWRSVHGDGADYNVTSSCNLRCGRVRIDIAEDDDAYYVVALNGGLIHFDDGVVWHRAE